MTYTATDRGEDVHGGAAERTRNVEGPLDPSWASHPGVGEAKQCEDHGAGVQAESFKDGGVDIVLGGVDERELCPPRHVALRGGEEQQQRGG